MVSPQKQSAPGTSAERRYVIDGHSFRAAPADPGLHITATPIGNLGDITLRALQVLAGVDVILCEDTRVTRKLTSRYGITTPLQPYHDHNAAKVRPGILKRLEDGASIALVSDAGTPLVSDPGFKLALEARELGLPVHAIPGASAVLAGLTISGLPSDAFMFAGFLPHKSGERRRRLADLADIPATVIYFDTASRIESTLSDIADILGDRPVAVTRELTKLHEEAITGSAREVIDRIAARDGIRGEITLLIAPPDRRDAVLGEDDLDAALRDALAEMTASRAAAHVAKELRLPRKQVYARALALQGDHSRAGNDHRDVDEEGEDS